MGVKKLCMSKVAMGCGCWLGLPDEAMDRERKKKRVRDLRCWNLEYTLLWVCESVRSEGRDFGFGGCGKPQEDDFQREEEEAVVTLGDQNVQLCTQILTFSFFFSRFSRKEM